MTLLSLGSSAYISIYIYIVTVMCCSSCGMYGPKIKGSRLELSSTRPSPLWALSLHIVLLGNSLESFRVSSWFPYSSRELRLVCSSFSFQAYIHATRPTSPVLKSLLRCVKFISGQDSMFLNVCGSQLLTQCLCFERKVNNLTQPAFVGTQLKPSSQKTTGFLVLDINNFAGSILAALLLVALWDDPWLCVISIHITFQSLD